MRLTLLAAAAAIATASPAAAQPGPVPVQPQATDFRLGTLKLTSLRDYARNAPNDAKVFGVEAGVPAVARVLTAAGKPGDSIELSVNTLLVRLPGHLVLIDTGYGVAGATKGILLASLARAGVTPAQITDILISHSHGDHIGGTLGADDRPVFANARIHMAAAEWEFLQGNPANAALVAAIGSQVKTFQPGAQLFPAITAVALEGHTPGHSGYRITSGRARMLAIGDMAHSYIVSLAKPEWIMGFDRDKAVGAATRRATFTALATSKEQLFSPHFPYPGIGRVVASGEGFKWQPSKAR